jgi:Bacteriophage tail sheath protein
MSSNPEWKYVNVRRLFLYVEPSIDQSTQWAVFELNRRTPVHGRAVRDRQK